MEKNVKNKNPFFKRGWFWLGIIVLIIIISLLLYLRINITSSNVKDCGSYNDYISGKGDNLKTNEEKSTVISCFENAFIACTDAFIKVYSSDWEGGSHIGYYRVVKDKNSCKLKVDRSTDAWYVPGGKIQTIEICSSLEIIDNNIRFKDCIAE